MKRYFNDDWLVILFVLLGAAYCALQVVLGIEVFFGK